MMSSFASVFVANANATPENVVPWTGVSLFTLPISHAPSTAIEALSNTHKINANNQLCFASARSFHLDGRASASVLAQGRLWCDLAVAATVSRQLCRATSEGRVALWVGAGVDGRRCVGHMGLLGGWQRAGGARSTRVVGVAGRATQPRLARIHGQAGGGGGAAGWGERSAVDGG